MTPSVTQQFGCCGGHLHREALVNAYRHFGAGSVEFYLAYAANQLRILVHDDDCGIDPQLLRSGREGHWGLSGMRERAEKIGAKVKVLSRPGGGTEAELRVPSDIAFGTRSPNLASHWFKDRYRRHKEYESISNESVGK